VEHGTLTASASPALFCVGPFVLQCVKTTLPPHLLLGAGPISGVSHGPLSILLQSLLVRSCPDCRIRLSNFAARVIIAGGCHVFRPSRRLAMWPRQRCPPALVWNDRILTVAWPAWSSYIQYGRTIRRDEYVMEMDGKVEANQGRPFWARRCLIAPPTKHLRSPWALISLRSPSNAQPDRNPGERGRPRRRPGILLFSPIGTWVGWESSCIGTWTLAKGGVILPR
jgi:hypothetical protein